MKRIIALILALITIVAVFASCGDSVNAQTSPNQSSSKPTVGGGGDDVPEDQKINLDLDSIDYGGDTVYMAHWDTGNTAYDEFGMEADQINNDAVNDSLYKRNLYTEQSLGITLDFYGITKSNYVNVSNFINKLTTRKNDPMTPIDIIASQGRVMPYVILEGLLTDLNVNILLDAVIAAENRVCIGKNESVLGNDEAGCGRIIGSDLYNTVPVIFIYILARRVGGCCGSRIIRGICRCGRSGKSGILKECSAIHAVVDTVL